MGRHRFRPTGDSSISIAAEDASPRPTPLGPTPLGPTPLGESPETPNDSAAGSPNGCKAAAPGGDSPGPPPATRSADSEGASARCSAPLLRLVQQGRPPLPQLVSADAEKLARIHVLARMLSA